MVRGELHIDDHGPDFQGWAGRRTAERIVCVAPPQFKHDASVRGVVRELVRNEGGNCTECGNCPIGRDA